MRSLHKETSAQTTDPAGDPAEDCTVANAVANACVIDSGLDTSTQRPCSSADPNPRGDGAANAQRCSANGGRSDFTCSRR